jgi:hypothetical protein
MKNVDNWIKYILFRIGYIEKAQASKNVSIPMILGLSLVLLLN